MRRNTRTNAARPKTVQELQDLIASAVAGRRSVVPSGAGHSYDAVRSANEMTLDLSLFQHVLDWNLEQGIIQVQPGVTIDELWRTVVGGGWWPEVLPSRLEATIGGCLAVNTSGANAWHTGSLGEYVQAFDLLLPSGRLITVTPWDNTELFYSAIGGLGMLGVITSITLQLRRIRSGKLLVREQIVNSFAEMFEIFAEKSANEGYLIGNINSQAREDALGSGVVICGDLTEWIDLDSLPPNKQGVQASIVKIASSSIFNRALQPLVDWNIKISNNLLSRQSMFNRNGYVRYMPIAQFHFPFGLVNYSLRSILSRGSHFFHPFVPAMQAQRVFTDLLQLSQRSGFVPLWCIMRKHRADQFVLSCRKVDGFSLELVYHASSNDEARLVQLLKEMLNRVIEAGGRLSLAQDRILDAQAFERMMGNDTVNRFLQIKGKYDPDYIFQSNLFRRLFQRE
jgi:decaprenylphospho-beta-D-ribofuranose 2-oxidase